MLAQSSNVTLRDKKSYSSLYFLISMMVWLLVFIALYLMLPLIPTFDTGSLYFRGRYILPLTSGMLLVLTTLFVVQSGVRLKIRPLYLFIGLACFVILDNYAHSLPLIGFVARFIISDLAIIFCGICLGKLIAQYTIKRSWIVPIALVSMIADLWSRAYGPSSIITEQNLSIIQHFFIFYPLLGAPTIWERTYSGLTPFIGMGDVIFLSLYLELARKFELHRKSTRWAMIVALMIAISMASLAEQGVPALPFMAAFFIFVNYRYLEFRRKELLQTLIFILILVFILLVLYHNPHTRRILLLQG